jgi:uncharacterized protein
MSMYQASFVTFDTMLTGLSNVLRKAAAHCEAKKIDPEALLSARLYPDMFAMKRQVQVTCDFAKGATARLAGVEVPSYPDDETSFDELQARIAKTRTFIASLPKNEIEASATRIIKVKVAGTEMEMPGDIYLSRMATPNFYFHYTTAYAILRHNGVELGKGDFMAR